jgi:hypothetical protein
MPLGFVAKKAMGLGRISSPKAMKREKNITRFDYGKTHGWWVRFQRSTDAGIKRVVSKMFSDAVHGGKTKALKAAVAWRNQTAATIRPARRRTPRASGYVKRVELTRRVGVSPVYLAWIRMPDGRAASTSFSIEKWGERGAKRRCQLYLARKRREAGAAAR